MQGLFQSTRPVRGATVVVVYPYIARMFQSTRPVRGATHETARLLSVQPFQSTRPVRGATSHRSTGSRTQNVSIHAPRAGRDRRREVQEEGVHGFNPRAPCGARLGRFSFAVDLLCFNPRAPCGARLAGAYRRVLPWRFNPRAPCGARRAGRCTGCGLGCFNPRAPCGARQSLVLWIWEEMLFQSTRPVRGATFPASSPICARAVSIHAPRAGRDGGLFGGCLLFSCFNPRAPCGARRVSLLHRRWQGGFQSTRPVRGATWTAMQPTIERLFQSTRPVRGATLGCIMCPYQGAFQSTRPVRGATLCQKTRIQPLCVSIHAPRAGRDRARQGAGIFLLVSIHAPRAGRDCSGRRNTSRIAVSIHAPRAGRDLALAKGAMI